MIPRYQKYETNLDFTEARDSEWHWHQLGHMQVCTSLQTDNHSSTPPLSFYRPAVLPATQRNRIEIGNRNANNIKIAIENANLCGKICDYTHFAEMSAGPHTQLMMMTVGGSVCVCMLQTCVMSVEV